MMAPPLPVDDADLMQLQRGRVADKLGDHFRYLFGEKSVQVEDVGHRNRFAEFVGDGMLPAVPHQSTL